MRKNILHQDVTKFLSEGEPPVYIGFGVMPAANPKLLLQNCVQAINEVKMRAVFCGENWFMDELEEYKSSLPSNTFHFIKYAPHSWLFPRCSIAVHHGGAGTSGSSFQAGIPTVIFPIVGDHTFWASRAKVLGVGPQEFVSFHELTTPILVKQLKDVSTDFIQDRAKALGKKLQQENGVEKTVELFERIYSQRRNTSAIRLNWLKDSDVPNCQTCSSSFTFLHRRHHCRSCGGIFCENCLGLFLVPSYPDHQMVCQKCFDAREDILTG